MTTSSTSPPSTEARLSALAIDMAAQRLGLRVVERAAIGLADRRARGRDDDGFTHGDLQIACSLRFTFPSPSEEGGAKRRMRAASHASRVNAPPSAASFSNSAAGLKSSPNLA